jgi:cell filamentation protein
MPFDPFGDFQTRGYLRNSLGVQDRRAIGRAGHLAFRAHVPHAPQAPTSRETLRNEDVLSTHQQLFGSLYP